ncbi:MAG TPA: hypothetical protein VHE79_12215, partial [Spirochaetia bacterium]
SEAVVNAVREGFLVRRLGRVRYAGKDDAVRLFELVAEKDDSDAKLAEAMSAFEEGLTRYEARDYRGARERFARCLRLLPGDGPSSFYIERCGKQGPHGEPGITSIPG